MILSDVTTQGDDNYGRIYPLISGGEFYVTALQGGTPVRLKQYYSY